MWCPDLSLLPETRSTELVYLTTRQIFSPLNFECLLKLRLSQSVLILTGCRSPFLVRSPIGESPVRSRWRWDLRNWDDELKPGYLIRFWPSGTGSDALVDSLFGTPVNKSTGCRKRLRPFFHNSGNCLPQKTMTPYCDDLTVCRRWGRSIVPLAPARTPSLIRFLMSGSPSGERGSQGEPRFAPQSPVEKPSGLLTLSWQDKGSQTCSGCWGSGHPSLSSYTVTHNDLNNTVSGADRLRGRATDLRLAPTERWSLKDHSPGNPIVHLKDLFRLGFTPGTIRTRCSRTTSTQSDLTLRKQASFSNRPRTLRLQSKSKDFEQDNTIFTQVKQ